VSSGWWPLSNPVLEREAPTIIVHPPQRSVIPGPFGKRIQERKEIIRGSCRKSVYFISKMEVLSAKRLVASLQPCSGGGSSNQSRAAAAEKCDSWALNDCESDILFYKKRISGFWFSHVKGCNQGAV